MKSLIVANWKCNPTTLAEAKQIFSSIKRGIKNLKDAEVVICPPFPYLSIMQTPGVCKLGGQNCFWEEKGAFTGEISPVMLKDLGCQYVIVGHSERRKYFQETDEVINKKIKAALGQDLNVILCVGKVSQIKKAIKGLSKKQFKNLVLAYEPVFAIGTGKSCSIEKARKMRALIKETLKANIKILYGGSVNSKNAFGYLKEAGMSGLLVGGASLDPKKFVKIIKSAIILK